jgi:hypothetical protein
VLLDYPIGHAQEKVYAAVGGELTLTQVQRQLC